MKFSNIYCNKFIRIFKSYFISESSFLGSLSSGGTEIDYKNKLQRHL